MEKGFTSQYAGFVCEIVRSGHNAPMRLSAKGRSDQEFEPITPGPNIGMWSNKTREEEGELLHIRLEFIFWSDC